MRTLTPIAAACLVLAAVEGEAQGPAPQAPAGAIAFFDAVSCPAGWSAASTAAGMLIVGTVTPADVGKTVGTPLADKEDRTHTHDYATTVTLDEKSISGGSGCCNKQGAAKGAYDVKGTSNAATSGLPFMQLVVCRKS